MQMKESERKNSEQVSKAYLTGTPMDSETWKKALVFLGILIMVYFVTLVVCSMTGFTQTFLRIGVNLIIVAGILVIFFNNGLNQGSGAVARGEIAFHKQENGKPLADSERKICYHPLKGFLVALLGTLPIFVLALILSLMTTRQTASQGTLPGWLQPYLTRSEISLSLSSYTNPAGISALELVRILVRIVILPFINLAGSASDKDATLLLERFSPLLVLLPAAAYGFGYMRGPSARSQIHTEIAENARRRIRREKKERRQRRQPAAGKGPQQLN